MEAHTLCVDIGNSSVKAALFSEEGAMLQSFPLAEPSELFTIKASKIAYIDTRLDTAWRSALESQGAIELVAEKGLPFPSQYSERLGPDRAAQLIAVWAMGRFPAVIVSLGTACTIDYMDESGQHQGGMITAGINLRLWALAQRTGRLPQVSPLPDAPLLGKDTEEAIRAGVIGGFQRELSAQLERLRQISGDFSLWITGGEADLLKTTLPAGAIFAPELTLRGVWLWQRFLASSGHNSPIIP